MVNLRRKVATASEGQTLNREAVRYNFTDTYSKLASPSEISTFLYGGWLVSGREEFTDFCQWMLCYNDIKRQDWGIAGRWNFRSAIRLNFGELRTRKQLRSRHDRRCRYEKA